MRRPTLALLLAALAASPCAAEPSPLAEARQRMLRGNDAEAEERYVKLAESPETRDAARIGLAQVARQRGRRAESLKLLEGEKSAEARALRAEFLHADGRWDDALALADAVIAEEPESFRARYVRACVLRDRGELEEADAAMRWLVRAYSKRSDEERDIADPDTLMLVARAGLENARAHRLSDQFKFILNELLADVLKAEPDHWPAESLAGEMLLEKFNRPDALAAFDKALAINPKAADAHAGKGRVALGRFEFAEVERHADAALKSCADHPGALCLLADVRLAAGEYDRAAEFLKRARAASPRDPAALARLALVAHRTGDKPGFDALLAEGRGWGKRPGELLAELAHAFEGVRLYAEAARFYEESIAARPGLSAPLANLGLLHLRTGDEAAGQKRLTEALAADPFHIRVANALKVLRHLDEYATIETPHYTLRYAAEDVGLAQLIADDIEAIHTRLKGQFGYEPPGKTLVQVFRTHEMFSGRMTALPDLHTIGACTGRVVALAGPHAKGVRKPYNWARVLRHELTHVFNLAQTDHQCPHWLTEGLAVRNEDTITPENWQAALSHRHAGKDLLNLGTINLGFIRPRSGEEWALSYYQARLYIDHLTATHGEAVVGKLLAAYAAGKTTPEAIRAATGADVATLEKAYSAYLDAVVAKLPKAPPLEMGFASLEEMEKAADLNPKNLDLAVRLARALASTGSREKAQARLEAVLAEEPEHPRAALLKAEWLVEAKDQDAAAALLRASAEEHPDDPDVVRAAAKLSAEAKDWDAAVPLLERGRALRPGEAFWHEWLSKGYAARNDMARRRDALDGWAACDADAAEPRAALADLHAAAERWPESLAAAREALRIDARDAKVRSAFVHALTKLGRADDAAEWERKFAGK